MANQMIALQARNPQLPDPARQTAQMANMMNMASQQRASQLQGERLRQEMAFEAAKEAREVELQAPKLSEAQSKANSERLKYVMDFFGASEIALYNSRNPQQAMALGDRMKQMFPEPELQQSIDQTLSSIPQDPAQFEAWREDSLIRTMDAKDQTARDYMKQTTGTEERIVGLPKYGRGAATEVPGSRIQVAQGMQYITDDQGNVRAVPKETGGGFDTSSTAGAPAKGSVAAALQTNPGALKDGAFARSQAGYTGASGGFATFKTPEDGARAQENLLRTAYVNKGFNTIDKIINRYAPQGPENSAASVSNYKKYVARQTGIDMGAPIAANQIPAVAKAMREFETGQTQGRGTAGGGAPIVVAGSGAKAKPSTEGERRFGTISRQMRTNLKKAVGVLEKNPDAIRPSGLEYAASQIPFYGEEARLFAESEPRQQFVSTILRFLDNVTFVNTGAGTSKTQEDNYRRSYIPTFQDTPTSAYEKLVSMVEFAKNVKDAAGVLWTPELDADFNALTKAVAKLKPKGKTPVQRKASGGFTVVKVED
jgi:hypothetical protein